ncbi:MAG: DUF3108 domain-containing protein, partial [Gammaproteobacteria bacterium]|nr:DUF3108 domain-containing protein [Gammaproteobacteria bacterium]
LKSFLFFILAANSYSLYASPENTQTQNILPDYKAYYALKKAGITIARTVVEFSHDDKTFTYSSHSKTVGLVAIFRDDQIMEKTTGQWINGQIRPDTYRYQRTGKKKKTKNIDFNWTTNKAMYEENNNKTAIDIRKHTVDEFSNQLAITLDLMKNPQIEGTKLSFPVVDDAILKQRAFIVEGKEKIKVKAGDFETIRIKRLRYKGMNRITYFWFAPTLHLLPVKIEHIESDGGKISLELIKVETGTVKAPTNE